MSAAGDKADVELAERVLGDCHGVKDLYAEIEERVEQVRNLACDIGDLSDAADAAEVLASLLRGLAEINADGLHLDEAPTVGAAQERNQS